MKARFWCCGYIKNITINVPQKLYYFDKLLGRGEAADAQGEQDPAAGVAALGRVLGELFADLTVDLVPETQTSFTSLQQLPVTGHNYFYTNSVGTSHIFWLGARVGVLVAHLRAGRKMPLPMMK